MVLVEEERKADEGLGALGHDDMALQRQLTSDMVRLGAGIVQDASQSTFERPTAAMVGAAGGKAKVLEAFARFYERLFMDELMSVLFNESAEERPAKEHGLLLGSFVLGFITGDRGYRDALRSGKGHGLGLGHERAKSCPMRPAEHRGRGFTWRQSRAWIGHLSSACDDVGTGNALRDSLTRFLARQLFRYGPFIDDREGVSVHENDWDLE